MPFNPMVWLGGLPAPIRFGLMVVAGFLVFTMLKDAGWYLVVAAVVLWGIVLLGLGHRMGWMPALTSRGSVAPLLDRLTAMPPARSGAPRTAQASGADRQKIATEAREAIVRLAGRGASWTTPLNALIALAESARQRHERGFGTARPGTLLALYGAAGTGKTTVAREIARFLFGYEIVSHADVVEITAGDVSSYSGSLASLAESKASESLDRILLIDGADWLVTSGTGSTTAMGSEFGAGLGRIATNYPGRMMVMIVGGAALERRLLEDSEQRSAWLNKFDVFKIPFESMDRETLFQVFQATLQNKGVGLAPDGAAAAHQAIDAAMKAEGDRFANVLTVQDIVSGVLRQASLRAQSSQGGGAGRPLTISRSDFAQSTRN